MASKSQRRKEKHKRKREEKKAQLRRRHDAVQRNLRSPLPGISAGSQARHRERVSAQKPVAWPGELPEDVAVFDETVVGTLPSELADQAALVREALQLASDSQGEAALQKISTIPRSSPYSEWRLFVRGLVDWLGNAVESAGNSWGRLDPQRRPGRMAVAMMCAVHSNLDQLKLNNGEPIAGAGPVDWTARLDDTLLYHAKLLRRERFDRTAIRLAEAAVRVPEEVPSALLGVRKLEWLIKFSQEFAESEPDLVDALQQVALRRASQQPYVDVFRMATRHFEGPKHDPNNHLRSFQYYGHFEKEEFAQQSLASFERYLQELPSYEALPKQLRGAIASMIFLFEAEDEIVPQRSRFERLMFGEEVEDSDHVRQAFTASIQIYPGNRAAYEKYVDWLQSKDDDGLTQKEREPILRELCDVMQAWSKGLPEDVEPRLWLVDHLLEEERTKEVKPHVDWLAASRQDNPHVRAAPWKWNMLEAMRLCRRKTQCPQALVHLDEADRCWPVWISKDWLPYLRAAVAFRGGDTAAFKQREAIWEHNAGRQNSLVDECMMLGAAQRMRLPAADVKVFRSSSDAVLKQLKQLPLDQLLDAIKFFWDLHRTNLQYPAYRMHAKKIVDTAVTQLESVPSRVLANLDDKRIQATLLLASEMRCFDRNNQTRFPSFLQLQPAVKHPICVAAMLNASLRRTYAFGFEQERVKAELLRDAAQSESDPFYRHWFAVLADRLDEASKASKTDSFGMEMEGFARMFASMADDDDYDDDDYEDDDDY